MIKKEGPGWRLARDPSRNPFPFLIAGENWAIELTEDEWFSLAGLIFDLVDQHEQLEGQLMPEETLLLELERSPWWGALDGDRSCWSLQLILNECSEHLRSVELHWPVPAAQEIVSAMRNIWDSSND